MFYVGICRLCGEGLLGVRVCGAESVVLCDECDALWSEPPSEDRKPLMVRADPPCPGCGETLWGDQAHWASRSEVEAVGWWDHVAGEAGNRDEPGGPRSPDRIQPLTDVDSDALDDPESGFAADAQDSDEV